MQRSALADELLDQEEPERRQRASDRVAGRGASQVFEHDERGDGDAPPFLDPAHRFFAYEVAGPRMPPVAEHGPFLRMSRFFATLGAARVFGAQLNDAAHTTVFVGMVHAWHVCPDSFDDATRGAAGHEAHRDRLLAAHEALTRKRSGDTAARVYEYKNLTPHTVEEWGEAAHIEPAIVAKLAPWADENGFTVERLGTIEDAEAQQLGVPGPHIREQHAAWRERVAAAMAAAVEPAAEEGAAVDPGEPVAEEEAAVDPVAEEEAAVDPGEPAAEEEEASARAGPPVATFAAIPDAMRGRAHRFAVLSIIADDDPRARHIFRVYGAFAERIDAEVYIRNVAGDVVKDHDMFIVSTCEWLDPTHRTSISNVTHRDPELDRMMRANRAQGSRIRRAKATIERPPSPAKATIERPPSPVETVES